jgi:NAD(P)-dependent dehydrogenase (short-subunit alcohol dehydrogenase family)
MMNGRHVMITGGTGALGSAVVKRFLEAGATCHVTWIERHEIERFAHAKEVTLHEMNGADERAVERAYGSLPSLFASVHLAGGFAMAPIEKTSADDMRRMFEMNAMTCFLCCREAVKKMRASGTGGGGRIVNVAARPAVQPAGGMIAYSTSKAAVASITQSLAEEVKNERILVNAVLPSIMDTPANRKAMPNAEHDNWPKVEEVAEMIAFLASEQNALTTGALVPVFGQA